jgi:hypothetical protein
MSSPTHHTPSGVKSSEGDIATGDVPVKETKGPDKVVRGKGIVGGDLHGAGNGSRKRMRTLSNQTKLMLDTAVSIKIITLVSHIYIDTHTH